MHAHLRHLIPVTELSVGFSTCRVFDRHFEGSAYLGGDGHHNYLGLTTISGVGYVELDGKRLGVHKVVKSQRPPVVVCPPIQTRGTGAAGIEQIWGQSYDAACPAWTLPDPTEAWEAFYPKGSINPGSTLPGGFGLYLSGTDEFMRALAGISLHDGSTSEASSSRRGGMEVVMSYRLMFESGWEWGKGGKLPGIFGGVGDLAYGCTGGRREKRCACFDVRLMWRENGEGEVYTYLPLTPNNANQQSKVPPYSKQNSDYGFTVGRGAWSFNSAVGRWMSIAIRVRLNDITSSQIPDSRGESQDNGEIEVWVDGKSVVFVNGLTLSTTADTGGQDGGGHRGVDTSSNVQDVGRIKGMHFQTFFGGHSDEWASPKDQKAWFADITGVVS